MCFYISAIILHSELIRVTETLHCSLTKKGVNSVIDRLTNSRIIENLQCISKQAQYDIDNSPQQIGKKLHYQEPSNRG
ncbi:hypothetical protein GQ457_12G003560 [Hibiscus cannabinus]